MTDQTTTRPTPRSLAALARCGLVRNLLREALRADPTPYREACVRRRQEAPRPLLIRVLHRTSAPARQALVVRLGA